MEILFGNIVIGVKMISNCRGCHEEWSYACDLATNCGATLVQQEITHIGERRHFRIRSCRVS
mgnify:FL=1